MLPDIPLLVSPPSLQDAVVLDPVGVHAEEVGAATVVEGVEEDHHTVVAADVVAIGDGGANPTRGRGHRRGCRSGSAVERCEPAPPSVPSSNPLIQQVSTGWNWWKPSTKSMPPHRLVQLPVDHHLGLVLGGVTAWVRPAPGTARGAAGRQEVFHGGEDSNANGEQRPANGEKNGEE